jgi:hypothetical protein
MIRTCSYHIRTCSYIVRIQFIFARIFFNIRRDISDRIWQKYVHNTNKQDHWCTHRAARATRPHSPATAGGGPAPGGTCVCRHRRDVIAATRAHQWTMLFVFVRILFVSEMLGSYSTKNTLKYVHLHCVRILFVCTYLYVLLVYASICMYFRYMCWKYVHIRM